MSKKEFSLALKTLASGKSEIYQFLENKPFLRKMNLLAAELRDIKRGEVDCCPPTCLDF